MQRSFIIALFYLISLSLLSAQESGEEAAAQSGEEVGLEDFIFEYPLHQPSTPSAWVLPPKIESKKVVKALKPYQSMEVKTKPPKEERYASRKAKKNPDVRSKFNKGKKWKNKMKRARTPWKLNFKWIDLDWLTIGIVIALFFDLMLLFFLLFAGNVLSLFEFILFGLGFAFAMFSYFFLASESDGARGAYEFFVKYGLFSWPGILALIAGFAGLFGAMGNFWTYILIGLIIGGIAFLLSLIFGDSIFTGYEFRSF